MKANGNHTGTGIAGRRALTGILMILFLGTGFATATRADHPPGRQEGDFKRHYTGRLGYYPIELYMEKQQKNLSAEYIQRFKIRQRSIALTGYIDQQGQLHLEGKGIFTGSIQDGRITGYWYRSQDSREKYPFELEQKSPDYYSQDYWTFHKLDSDERLKIPRNSNISRLKPGELFSGRMSQLHPVKKDTAFLQAGYAIDIPIQDSSIVSRFSLELGVYSSIDSLWQLLPGDTSTARAAKSLVLDGNKVDLLGFEEGTTGGSYHSKLYFLQGQGEKYAYLFHLSYSFTNPWVYGNPYSKDDYEGPLINDMNRLIEIVEMIIASL
ncbi:MAG: hypothetical protein KGY70_17715 [Bacteroidales bacterium]|nr:hypothetical protein [Bacteroidales bacterium]